MAACGGLEHIFDNPLPESPTFLESLSPWKQIKSMKPVDHASFTDIFGGLCFKDDHVHGHDCPDLSLSSSSSLLSSVASSLAIDIAKIDINENKERSSCEANGQKKEYRHSESFSSMNSENLSLCTEGLGFESCDDVEDLSCCNNDWQPHEERTNGFTRNNSPTESGILWGECKRSRKCTGQFPPPISCIGRSGKPWVCFKSFRQDGRFILKEIRIPTQELLHARRENGRLRLQFIQADDGILEEDEDEEEYVGKNDDGHRSGDMGENNVEASNVNDRGSS